MTCRVCMRAIGPGDNECWRINGKHSSPDICYRLGYKRLRAAQPASAPALIAELADTRKALREAREALERKNAAIEALLNSGLIANIGLYCRYVREDFEKLAIGLNALSRPEGK